MITFIEHGVGFCVSVWQSYAFFFFPPNILAKSFVFREKYIIFAPQFE